MSGNPGEDKIDPATYPSLEKVATAISRLPNPVRLEGIRMRCRFTRARFHGNRELPAATAGPARHQPGKPAELCRRHMLVIRRRADEAILIAGGMTGDVVEVLLRATLALFELEPATA